MTAADRPSVTDNALDEEPLAWCPGCGDRILTRVVRERGVCSECWGTRDDPWAAARAETTTAHECDSGDFDRTICDCGAMHSYCTICGTRQDDCPHGTTTATPPGLTVSEDGSVLNWQGVNYVPQRAETATATDEDAARVLDDVIQHLRKIWSTGHDEAREVIDTAEELLAQALPHLATARTRPTRDELAKVICESRCSPQRKSWLETADAVLALLRGGA